jgi:hypothetical protein
MRDQQPTGEPLDCARSAKELLICAVIHEGGEKWVYMVCKPFSLALIVAAKLWARATFSRIQ